jgi:hypothetical protein
LSNNSLHVTIPSLLPPHAKQAGLATGTEGEKRTQIRNREEKDSQKPMDGNEEPYLKMKANEARKDLAPPSVSPQVRDHSSSILPLHCLFLDEIVPLHCRFCVDSRYFLTTVYFFLDEIVPLQQQCLDLQKKL